MQVFICYSRTDKEFAAHLVEDLSDYDVKVWMDVRSIPHGANWDMEVQKGLDGSDMMLVLLSPASSASQNVADEWSYFIDKNKPIVPLLLIPCEVPFRLSRRQRVDFTVDYKHGFQQLIRAIGSPDLVDPDSTTKIRPVTWNSGSQQPAPAESKPATAQSSKPIMRPPVAAPASEPVEKPIHQTNPTIAPEVGVKMLSVVWAESYHWFRGLEPEVVQGDAMVNKRELKLIPHAKPIVTIPLRSLVSAKIERSVDNHLKLTYYGPDGAFRSLVLMGAPKDRRKAITVEVLNLLKLLTGRSLD